MPRRTRTELHPKLVAVIQALARVMVEQQLREEREAAGDLADLRAALGVEDDPAAWKRKAEGLMKAFYANVPRNLDLPLKVRVRIVAAAVRELGRTASYRRVSLRAGELFDEELTLVDASKPPARRGRRTSRATPSDIVVQRSP